MKKVYKVLLIGSKSRTDIINKAKKLHLFSEHSSTAGMTSFNFDISKEKVLLQLMEASCTEKFKSFLPMYCKDVQGVAFVFDINQRSTFDEISQLIPIAQSNSPKDAIFFLIGVKCENIEEKQVPDKDVSALIRQYHLKSAKFSPKDESTSILFSIARIIHTQKASPNQPAQAAPPQKMPPTTNEPPQQKPDTQRHSNMTEHEHAPPTDQSVQSLSRQLTIAQKKEKFYQDKNSELEEKLKELTEKLEQSIENEKKLTEKVNYLTKKLHTVTLQKIHNEQQNGEPPSFLTERSLSILSVDEIEKLRKDDQSNSESAATKVTSEECLMVRTIEASKEIEPDAQKKSIDEVFKIITDVNKLGFNSIVKTVGLCYGDDTHRPSIVTEFVDSNLRDSVSSLSSSEKARVAFQIASTMKIVHQKGIAHRRLNPNNVLVNKDHSVKIADFSLSLVSKKDLTSDGEIVNFLAPEILSQNEVAVEDIEKAKLMDVFAFGSILLFLLTDGKMTAISVDEMKEGKVPEIPGDVNDLSRGLIQKCWSFEPAERPQFAAIVESLENGKFMIADDVEQSLLNF